MQNQKFEVMFNFENLYVQNTECKIWNSFENLYFHAKSQLRGVCYPRLRDFSYNIRLGIQIMLGEKPRFFHFMKFKS